MLENVIAFGVVRVVIPGELLLDGSTGPKFCLSAQNFHRLRERPWRTPHHKETNCRSVIKPTVLGNADKTAITKPTSAPVVQNCGSQVNLQWHWASASGIVPMQLKMLSFIKQWSWEGSPWQEDTLPHHWSSSHCERLCEDCKDMITRPSSCITISLPTVSRQKHLPSQRRMREEENSSSRHDNGFSWSCLGFLAIYFCKDSQSPIVLCCVNCQGETIDQSFFANISPVDVSQVLLGEGEKNWGEGEESMLLGSCGMHHLLVVSLLSLGIFQSFLHNCNCLMHGFRCWDERAFPTFWCDEHSRKMFCSNPAHSMLHRLADFMGEQTGHLHLWCGSWFDLRILSIVTCDPKDRSQTPEHWLEKTLASQCFGNFFWDQNKNERRCPWSIFSGTVVQLFNWFKKSRRRSSEFYEGS